MRSSRSGRAWAAWLVLSMKQRRIKEAQKRNRWPLKVITFSEKEMMLTGRRNDLSLMEKEEMETMTYLDGIAELAGGCLVVDASYYRMAWPTTTSTREKLDIIRKQLKE